MLEDNAALEKAQSEKAQTITNHELVINRVKAGESEAFAIVVADFQDVALASAYAWLDDIELARDAVQEAFLDAYLKLDQLREPAAFPGWFRRIVLKHCDRQSRKKSLAVVSLDDSERNILQVSASEEQASNRTSLLNTLLLSERNQEVRDAVEYLPQEQRLVVALHYFGDVTGKDIAAFLELPLSTVKKRLRVARKHLKQTSQEGEFTTMKNLKTELKANFPDEIALFVAIREKDHSAVEKLLEKAPDLVNAEQNWERELVYNGTLPFATRATALITTIEFDDIAMLKLLLEKGADPDGACGCVTGESPIWAAALLNRVAHVELLLSAGASPNVFAASGNTPLHIAAMRGHVDIVKLLLASGADPEVREQEGKAIWPITAGAPKTLGWRPIDWATHNAHSEIVNLLEGESEPVTQTRVTVIDQPLIETGIKAVDFFTPLQRGGLIRVPFKAGVGMMVLLGELSRVYLSHGNGAVVWTGFTQAPFDIADLDAEMSEFGLTKQVHVNLVSYTENVESQREGFARGIELIDSLQREGKEVLAVIQSTAGFEADVEQAMFKLAQSNKGGQQSKPRTASQQVMATSIVLTPFRDEDQTWLALKAPYTSQITLDRSRSIKNLYPGVDPASSMSKISSENVGELHWKLLAEVRELLAWYRQQDPVFERVSEMSEDKKFSRAQKIIHYLTQPFKISEPFRGTPGESIPRQQMLQEIQALMRS